MARLNFVRGAFIALLVLQSAPTLAQNLLTNPNFDIVPQLGSWSTYLSSAPDPTGTGAAPAWNTADYTNSVASGSALTDTTVPGANSASGIAQCAPFSSTSVSTVNYGIGVRVPAATTTDGAVNATVEMRLFSNNDCTGFLAGGTQGRTLILGLASDTNWYLIGDAAFMPASPVLAQSAQLRAYLRQVNGTAPTTTDYKVTFDAAHLLLNTSTPVRLQQFDVE